MSHDMAGSIVMHALMQKLGLLYMHLEHKYMHQYQYRILLIWFQCPLSQCVLREYF